MTEWTTVKPLTCVTPANYYAVVVTHPTRRCVGPHLEKRRAADRWSGANITRANDESLTRSCPLMFLVQGKGLISAETPVLHLGQRGGIAEAHLEAAAIWLVVLRVQQVIWIAGDVIPETSYRLDIEEIVRRARLYGAASSVLPELFVYSARVEGVGNALDSA